MFEADIEAVKEALEGKMYLGRAGDPPRKIKWIALLVKLAAIHEVDRPKLLITPRVDGPGYTSNEGGHIYLDKWSIISLLHEFGHHLGMNHSECVEYGETVFFGANPEARENLVRDGGGFLVRQTPGVERTTLTDMLDQLMDGDQSDDGDADDED